MHTRQAIHILTILACLLGPKPQVLGKVLEKLSIIGNMHKIFSEG